MQNLALPAKMYQQALGHQNAGLQVFAALSPQVLTVCFEQLLVAVVASALQLPVLLCDPHVVCCVLGLIEPNAQFWLCWRVAHQPPQRTVALLDLQDVADHS